MYTWWNGGGIKFESFAQFNSMKKGPSLSLSVPLGVPGIVLKGPLYSHN